MVTDKSGTRSDSMRPARSSQAPGAKMLRHALPQVLLLIVLNWLLTTSALRGLYPLILLAPLQIIASGLLLLLIFWRAARMVNLDHEARLRAMQGLSDTTSILAAVSDSIADPVIVKNRDGLLVFANQAALAMLGKTREEATNADAPCR